MKIDSPIDNNPKNYSVVKCEYCGKFIGKKDKYTIKTIYGFMSPDKTIVYHNDCKK